MKKLAKYLILRIRRMQLRRAMKVVLGAGGITVAGWIATDRDVLDLTDPSIFADIWPKPFVSHFLAEHVWEHLEPSSAVSAVASCARALIPGGRLRIAVPDGRHPDSEYIEAVRPGGQGPGAHDHKCLYTVESLSELIERGGLRPVPLEWWDKEGVFHREDWDPADGPVTRSAANDPRNSQRALAYTSLIVDAVNM
jgi:predicted SAM-dependent methyltransferase